jgi:hypothetical protein
MMVVRHAVELESEEASDLAAMLLGRGRFVAMAAGQSAS